MWMSQNVHMNKINFHMKGFAQYDSLQREAVAVFPLFWDIPIGARTIGHMTKKLEI